MSTAHGTSAVYSCPSFPRTARRTAYHLPPAPVTMRPSALPPAKQVVLPEGSSAITATLPFAMGQSFDTK